MPCTTGSSVYGYSHKIMYLGGDHFVHVSAASWFYLFIFLCLSQHHWMDWSLATELNFSTNMMIITMEILHELKSFI